MARADAAKRLLDLGADANAQDITGRTPLHTAVAADAMGVFQVILKLSYLNLIWLKRLEALLIGRWVVNISRHCIVRFPS